MRPLAATELLDIWERGRLAPPWRQALLLLTAACPEARPEELARLSIGGRDGLLATLREWTFGSRLACVVDCPACGEGLEFDVDADSIRGGAHDVPEAIDVHAEGYRVVFRLPNTEDLAALDGLDDPDAARGSLLTRCILDVSVDMAEGAPEREPAPTAEGLPPGLREAIVLRMGEAGPLADIRIGLTCPACYHQWDASFDVATFFWREIDGWARRTLREVHILARAYGWSEREILSTSAWRRRIYLEMVQA